MNRHRPDQRPDAHWWLFVIALIAVGCNDDGELLESRCDEVQALPDNDSIVAIGDSMFDFIGGCADAPDLVGLELGEQVRNEAVGGATLIDDITEQYLSGSWRWVIADGGGNDMECEEMAECLEIAAELETTWRQLLDEITGEGARVALVGYPDFGIESESGELWALMGGAMMTQMEDLADELDAVHFVDLRPVMNGDAQPELFAPDGIHPTPEGAQVMADAIVTVIEAND